MLILICELSRFKYLRVYTACVFVTPCLQRFSEPLVLQTAQMYLHAPRCGARFCVKFSSVRTSTSTNAQSASAQVTVNETSSLTTITCLMD